MERFMRSILLVDTEEILDISLKVVAAMMLAG
jgi:hypothetical protein